MSEEWVKVRYVQRQPRPCGRVDLYFRKRGVDRSDLLTSPDGTQALKDEVDAILKEVAAAAEASRAPLAGTVGALLRAYVGGKDDQGRRVEASPEFLALASSTQQEYDRIAEELIEDLGDVLMTDVDVRWLREIRKTWATRGYKATNDRRQVLRNALKDAIDDDAGMIDPFTKVKKIKRPRHLGQPNPAWTDEEFAHAMDWCIERHRPGLRRALGLMRWGGFRRGTTCAIPLAARVRAIDKDGLPEKRLNWVTEKRLVVCDKREDPRLTQLLDTTPRRAVTIAYNVDGGAWTKRALSRAVERMLLDLAAKGLVRRVETVNDAGETVISCPLTLHGLRHARGVELAEGGASDAEIQAQLEQTTAAAAQIYRAQAKRKALADSAQDKVDGVIQLANARKQRASA